MHQISLIEGDGIGPEICRATTHVLRSARVPILWDVVPAGLSALEKTGDVLPSSTQESIARNKVALKGPLTTPIGEGFRSVNVALRRQFDLYASVRPVKKLTGVYSRYDKVDLVVVRENTEDLYAGVEHMVGKDAAESIKIITRQASTRICRYAMEFASRTGRKKVTAVHKANIMKLSDGLFLECCRAVQKDYPDIAYEEMIVDNMCMQLVLRPEAFDVLVAPNLYGDILSDLCAGLVGGLGIAPGANIGVNAAIFEPGHGSAPDIAGKNLANPSSMILSAAMMMDHLGETAAARKIRSATETVIAQGKVVTRDLGGTATCDEMAEAIAEEVAAL